MGRAGRSLIGAALTLSLGAGGAVAGRDSLREERARELDGVRRAIETRRERLGAVERQERTLLDTLEEIDREIAALRERVGEARRREHSAEAEFQRLREREDALRRDQERTRTAMAARAVALYKAGAPGPVRVVFSASSLPDLLARTQGLRTLLRHDRELLDRFQRESAELEVAHSNTRAGAEEHALARRRALAQAEAFEEQRTTKRALLSQVHADRTQQRAALVELEAAARALEETVANLGTEKRRRRGIPRGPAFSSLEGRLEPPVEAPVVRKFGRVVDAQFLTKTRRTGIDFAAPAGTAVRAVAPGEVRFAGWFRGYGKLVILDHGENYFTVFGHLEDIRVEVGDGVKGGRVIATVGESGSLLGPRLYFEIRHGSEPLDPERWLQSDGTR